MTSPGAPDDKRGEKARRAGWRRLLVAAALLLLALLFFALDLDRFLSLDVLKAQRAQLVAAFVSDPIATTAAFMAINIAALALCLPGAVLTLSLAGGAIFGFLWGTPIVLISVVIGDSLAFLAARYVGRTWVERTFGRHAARIDRGIERSGASYLLSLRLLAIIPFFVVNLAMGLTRMPLRIFAPVSFLGLLPATAIYVFTGTMLGSIRSPADVYSPQLIASFLLIGSIPLIVTLFKRRFRSSASAPRPDR